MSTSKRKKEQRQKQLQAEAKLKKYEKTRSINKPKSQFKELKANETYRREDNQSAYPSLSTSEFNTARREGQRYTGEYVKGIMESHKSNLLPVVSDEHIVAITKMRRN